MTARTLAEYWGIVKKHQRPLPVKPVNVVAIAKECGIRVFTAKGLSDDVSGLIKQDGDSYAIYVNDSHAKARQRFTIAHELAHLFLHRHLIGEGIADDVLYRSGLSSWVETEANAMAADILMPEDVVNRLAEEPGQTVRDLAAVFDVSPDTMSIRMGVPA